jgi:hypothetical protein
MAKGVNEVDSWPSHPMLTGRLPLGVGALAVIRYAKIHCLCRSKPLQDIYESHWSLLRESMWVPHVAECRTHQRG